MEDQQELVRLLQLAFSGERGAALGYRGHAASLRDPLERAHVQAIRLEELDHRQRVGRILAALHAHPSRVLELRTLCLGAIIAAFCQIGGWFLPMYGAGWIERRNIADYERAARLALHSGELRHANELVDLAEAEWEHERYFREKAASHPWARLLPIWCGPGPKSAIRTHVFSGPRNPTPALLVYSSPSFAGGPVEQLAGGIGVAGVACGLIDQV